jgi:hypothetical protein
MEELTAIIIEALSELLDLPVTGEISQNIWRALELDSAGPAIIGLLTEKAKLTLNDGQLHSGSIEIPGDPSIGLTFMTWPNAREDVRQLARDHFLHAASVLTQRYIIQGVLQFDLFLPPGERTEMRIAWLPTAEPLESLPEALRSPLFPWGGGNTSIVAPAPIGPNENDLIELASAAWELHAAMAERLRLWPDAGGPAALGLGDVHTRFETLVPRFNAASRRLELGHVMPVSRFDETWLPHNLANEQRFGSLAASLKADLARVWGSEARETFGQLWDLFATAHPDKPSAEEISPFQKAPLQRRPMVHAELPAQGCEIFISYAWSDKTRGVRDIYELLSGSRLAVWLDEEQHPADKQLDEEIAAAMLQAKCIVICLSREMLTRGGYAFREVLLALSHIPERCVVVRLDRVTPPPTLQSLRSAAWFERDGAEQLEAVVASMLQNESGPAAPKELAFGGPIISALAATLQSPKKRRRRKIQAKGRRREILLRAQLVDLAHNVIALTDATEFEAVAKLASEAGKVLRWSALRGRAAAQDTTVFLPALRARCGLFRAHVQLGSGARFQFHNSAAFKLLDEIVDIDLDLLRPAPRFGLLSGDCRIAVQDCLDSFHFAEDWFRGWPPRLLINLPGVSTGRANSIVQRMETRRDQLAERMFALRAIDELADGPDPTSSWSDTWKTMKNQLGQILSGSHPFTIAYLEQMNKTISEAMRSELAVVLADGAIESFFDGGYREELRFPTDFRLRVVVRCYRAEAAKHEMLASVRGTVFQDLLGTGSEGADLNVLYSAFFVPAKASGEFDYGLYMNCSPPLDGAVSEQLPAIFAKPFVTAEMLSEDERARISGNIVRDELD